MVGPGLPLGWHLDLRCFVFFLLNFGIIDKVYINYKHYLKINFYFLIYYFEKSTFAPRLIFKALQVPPGISITNSPVPG